MALESVWYCRWKRYLVYRHTHTHQSEAGRNQIKSSTDDKYIHVQLCKVMGGGGGKKAGVLSSPEPSHINSARTDTCSFGGLPFILALPSPFYLGTIL